MNNKSVQVYIGLGSNVGEREKNISHALEMLSRIISDIKTSSIHETPALMPEGAPADWNMDFLNMVIGGICRLSAEELLAELKKIEGDIGRIKRGHWSPREIDIDIIDYGGLVIDQPHLKTPHPEMHKREFVLLPLIEIAPDWQHPMLGKTARELANS